ncbi:hypothetical protein AeMF1_006359, partial [Aphanomyces euteiches]
ILGRLVYQDPLHVYDVDLNVDSVLVQIEKCLLVVVEKPMDWKSHLTELKYLEHMLEDVPLADSIDLVVDHLLLLAEHVRTLISSIESVVVKKACEFVESLARLFGARVAEFMNVVLIALVRTARGNIKSYSQPGEQCLEVVSTIARYDMHLVLDCYETTRADEIKLLALKQLAHILSSWTIDEFDVSYQRLEHFVVAAVEDAKTEEALGVARQVLFAFYEISDRSSNACSDTSEDARPVFPSSPRSAMKISSKTQSSTTWTEEGDTRLQDEPPSENINQACMMRDGLEFSSHAKADSIPAQDVDSPEEKAMTTPIQITNVTLVIDSFTISVEPSTMSPRLNQATHVQGTPSQSPEAPDPRDKISKVNRNNRIALVVFLATAIVTLVLVGCLVFPVAKFKEAPSSYPTAACDACGLLNRSEIEHVAGCEMHEPCCPLTLFPTGPLMSACVGIPSCCCPNSVSRRDQTYSLQCPTSGECQCEYVNTQGDSFPLTELINGLILVSASVVVLVMSCVWCCLWSRHVGKMKRALDTEQGARPV